MKPQTINGVSGNGKPRDWREICKEVLQETSSERMNYLLEELLEALEKRSSSEGQGSGGPRKI
jgi:pyruvate dehydrogenase complex dehydrogenase (E1) component